MMHTSAFKPSFEMWRGIWATHMEWAAIFLASTCKLLKVTGCGCHSKQHCGQMEIPCRLLKKNSWRRKISSELNDEKGNDQQWQ